MLTTARKIEIATAVMQDNRLGLLFICEILKELINEKLHRQQLIGEMYEFLDHSPSINELWFTADFPEARTERIEFLQKYIHHLKDTENEKKISRIID
jgi:hypothetical protein